MLNTLTDEQHKLTGVDLTVGYDKNMVLHNLSVTIPNRAFTVIIGPNGCGKSTLLRTLSRLNKPARGQVILNGKDIKKYRTKEVARDLGLLPQSAITPEGITVADLVGRGRYPHQQLFNRNSAQNAEVIQSAMRAASLTDLAHIPVDSLSGGQRQRAWVAMVLAQQTPLLLLDEPTTFLDISHQIELLELFKMLIIQRERTIVAVLHDLNHASRYADHLIVMKNGEIIEKGSPQEIITPSLVEKVFGMKCVTFPDPVSNTPMVVPLGS